MESYSESEAGISRAWIFSKEEDMAGDPSLAGARVIREVTGSQTQLPARKHNLSVRTM